jgi:hypothetical protein
VGHISRTREIRTRNKIIVGRPKGKRPLRRPRRKWEHNIKMDLKEIGCEYVHWIHSAQNSDQ